MPRVPVSPTAESKCLYLPTMSPVAQPISAHNHFNPYTENGGTILAVAGEDFAVIAGDTRQTEGYSIQTRYAPKVFRL
jgi:20S proteasome subunit beta 6